MKKITRLLTTALALTLTLTGCGNSSEKTVSTDGSTSMEKVIGALGEAFMEKNSGTGSVLSAR